MIRSTYEAGVWEQDRGLVVWSTHKTSAAAKKAAVKYARDQRALTGGALSWLGGVRDPSGTTTWFAADGSCEFAVRS